MNLKIIGTSLIISRWISRGQTKAGLQKARVSVERTYLSRFPGEPETRSVSKCARAREHVFCYSGRRQSKASRKGEGLRQKDCRDGDLVNAHTGSQTVISDLQLTSAIPK